MTDPRDDAAGPPNGVPPAMQSGSLQALRDLVSLAADVGPVVAKRAGLSQSELTALEHLMTDDLGPVELARKLGVTSAAASGIVDRLETRGHVDRVPHQGDGRRVSVVMTDEARREVVGHLMPMFVALAELDERLSDDERVIVERYLRDAVSALRQLL